MTVLLASAVQTCLKMTAKIETIGRSSSSEGEVGMATVEARQSFGFEPMITDDAGKYIFSLSQKYIFHYFILLGQTKKFVCLRSPDHPYFSAADPNLFYRQLFDPNFC